jgi:hypothetical protein
MAFLTGVGRAGLFACCWLLKNRFCLTAERAIRYVRLRRSPKSIETMRQAEFIIHYARYLKKLSDMQENGTLPDRDQNSIQQNHKILETGTQLSLPEPGLPHMINNDIRLTIPNDIQIQHIEAQITLADSLDTNLMSFHTQPPIATPVIQRRSYANYIYVEYKEELPYVWLLCLTAFFLAILKSDQ